MTLESDDRELQARFRELRDEVAESAPPFVLTPVSSADRRPVPWKLAAIGATAALVTLLVSGVFRNDRTLDSTFDLGVVAWRAPSDFLMDTPGRDLFRTIPGIDAAGFLVTNIGPDESVTDTSG